MDVNLLFKYQFFIVTLFLKLKSTKGIYTCGGTCWKIDPNFDDVKKLSFHDCRLQFPDKSLNILDIFAFRFSWQGLVDKIEHKIHDWIQWFGSQIKIYNSEKNQLTVLLTVIIFAFLYFLINHIGSSVENASITYSKIAFIMDHGQKVHTLNKIRKIYHKPDCVKTQNVSPFT